MKVSNSAILHLLILLSFHFSWKLFNAPLTKVRQALCGAPGRRDHCAPAVAARTGYVPGENGRRDWALRHPRRAAGVGEVGHWKRSPTNYVNICLYELISIMKLYWLYCYYTGILILRMSTADCEWLGWYSDSGRVDISSEIPLSVPSSLDGWEHSAWPKTWRSGELVRKKDG